MKYIVDRFEENFALCEDENGESIKLDREKLPTNIKEGDKLVQDGEEFYIEDNSEEKDSIQSLFDSLKKK